MLSFDIRSLTERAIAVDYALSADDPVWLDGDSKPSGAIQVKGRLSSAGPGRYYWHGTIGGDVELPSRRCLGNATGHVLEEGHLIFAEADTEGIQDDPDVFILDDRKAELDLRPALREQWLLHVPGFAVCRDDCRGLCPSCGADLNVECCDCDPSSTDKGWGALGRIRAERR